MTDRWEWSEDRKIRAWRRGAEIEHDYWITTNILRCFYTPEEAEQRMKILEVEAQLDGLDLWKVAVREYPYSVYSDYILMDAFPEEDQRLYVFTSCTEPELWLDR